MSVPFLLTAQPIQIDWQQCFGTTNQNEGISVFQGNNGYYLFGTGSNWPGGHGAADMVMIRTDSTGNLLWSKAYGGPGFDLLYRAREVPGNGFILAGGFQRDNYMDDFYILRIDTLGGIIWQKMFGDYGTDDYAFDVALTNDSGFLCVGVADSVVPSTKKVMVVKTDKDGNLKWQKEYGEFMNLATGNGVIPTSDNGAVICGALWDKTGADCTSHGLWDGWVLRIDESGNLLWQQCFGGSDLDFLNTMVETGDGGYLFGGHTFSNNGDVSGNHGEADFWVVRTDSAGSILWQKCYGGSDFESGNFLLKSNTGGYYFGGETTSFDGQVTGNHSTGMNLWDMWLIRISDNGDLLLEQCFGGAMDEELNGFSLSAEGKIVLAGNTYTTDNSGDVQCSFTANSAMWMVAVTDTMIVGTDQKKPVTSVYSAYPNPSSGIFTIDLDGPLSQGKTLLRISNSLGLIILEKLIPDGMDKIPVDLTGTPPGIYFYHLSDGETAITGKFIII